MSEIDAMGQEALSGEAEKRPRRHFGTDGVRGVVGETLTDDLVEALGRAATSVVRSQEPRARRS